MESISRVSSRFTIRPLETSEEVDIFFRLNTQTFRPDKDKEEFENTMIRRRNFIENLPSFRRDQLRGMFSGNTFLGGYMILERDLRLGSVQLKAGYISNLVVRHNYRNMGIATTLIEDAITYANSQKYTLIIGHGIPNFYHRFNCTDVLDITTHVINLEHILSQSSSLYQVRPATLNDAPEMLEIHDRHYNRYLGSFSRTLQDQEHQLQHWLSDFPPLLAVDSSNKPCGYLMLFKNFNIPYVAEVAADNWHATLALLQYHARLLSTTVKTRNELWWPLPPGSRTANILADHFPVKSITYCYPNEDWMVRPIHLSQLLQSILPLWKNRLQFYHESLPQAITFKIDGHTVGLELNSPDIRLSEYSQTDDNLVSLSLEVFTRLLFGYRTIEWAVDQADQYIPEALRPLLDRLFPAGQAWINETDSGLDHVQER